MLYHITYMLIRPYIGLRIIWSLNFMCESPNKMLTLLRNRWAIDVWQLYGLTFPNPKDSPNWKKLMVQATFSDIESVTCALYEYLQCSNRQFMTRNKSFINHLHLMDISTAHHISCIGYIIPLLYINNFAHETLAMIVVI